MARLKIYYEPDTKIIVAIEGDIFNLDQTKLIGKAFKNEAELKELIKKAKVKELKVIELKLEI